MTLDGGRTLVAMPYSHEINDKPAFEKFHRTADEFRDMICRQFDVLYREGAQSGRVMAIAIHPYLTGVPHRIDAFDAALRYICEHERVWKTTGTEIARHYRAQAGEGMIGGRPNGCDHAVSVASMLRYPPSCSACLAAPRRARGGDGDARHRRPGFGQPVADAHRP